MLQVVVKGLFGREHGKYDPREVPYGGAAL